MKKHALLIVALIILILSALLAEFADQVANKDRYALNLKKVLFSKKKQTGRFIDQLQTASDKEMLDIISKSNHSKIYLFRYINDHLDFWSSNAIPVYEIYPDSLFDERITQLFNSFYYVKHVQEDSAHYVGLIQIKSRYPYANEFLKSGFDPSYKLPDEARLSFNSDEGFAIFDEDNTYLFSIIISGKSSADTTRSNIATFFLILGLFILAIYVYRQFAAMDPGPKRRLLIAGLLIAAWAIRLIQTTLGLSVGGYSLFDPLVYADSVLVPSLGDLLINCLLIFISAVYLVRFIKWEQVVAAQTDSGKFIRIFLITFLMPAFYLYAQYFSNSLIFNSNITFQANKIDQLTFYSIISYFIHGVNFLAAGIVIVRLVQVFYREQGLYTFLPPFIISSVLVFAGAYLTGYRVDFISVVFYFIFFLIILWLSVRDIEVKNYPVLMILVLIFCTYSLVFFSLKSNKKEHINRSTLAVSLNNEHDPVAEYLFEDLSERIQQDTFIVNQLREQQIIIEDLYDYLNKKYFQGFWTKYHMQIALCGPEDSVLLEAQELHWAHCYGFFEELIAEGGLRQTGTNFYYLDLQSGRILYLGWFSYEIDEWPFELTLFIELDSKLVSHMLGYPELLLDEKFSRESLLENYSYAKYYEGHLVAQSGDFSYSLSPDLLDPPDKGFKNVSLDGYNHLVYRPGGSTLIVLSRQQIRFIDLLIAFSYLFLFYYLCLAVYVGARKISKSETIFRMNLRNRIQSSILIILVVSLILIAASTVWLSVRSYRLNQNTILHEKIQSVLIELTHKLEYEEQLTPGWYTDKYDNLNQLLIKFSDVFYSDINLYDPQGNLLATSRAEIFELGLQGEKMNPRAFYKLKNENRPQYIQREKISNLSYLSAYVPFKNANGDLLAYLNLPYFTKQKDLQSAITTLVVTVVNIYVILILITIVITIFISDQITRPLELLQLRFRELKLGGRYEKIHYKRRDEIGSLVAEYNRMVSELEQSVELLARSERESAWREMAKQIAHEIKNPLTPMRLGIQQLQRSWRDGREDFDKQLTTLAETLIEQIDTLSSIASEFSNFAKMPVAKIQNIDLVRILNKSVELFEGHTNCKLTIYTDTDAATIRADEKQLSRVFINLIKNAIQSVPDDREGIVNVRLETEEGNYVVTIADNGKGIPEEIQPKLFMPNFTTKSSGMGLGLAIVGNILDSLGATIDFSSEVGKGTIFRLKFPIRI